VAAPSAPATPAPVSPAPSGAGKSSETTPPANSDKAVDSDKPAPPPAADSAAKPDKDSAAKDTEEESSAAPSKPAEKPKAAAKAAAPKPSAAARPAGYDPVIEAKKYIYGRGAPHDCDRGMRLLKPEANRSNPKAMVEMGALYSAGVCTPRDLPTAYRWFALALRKDPENTSVQANLSKLWGEMTQPERQLAIKLTQ
jgi:TPR repeat protein